LPYAFAKTNPWPLLGISEQMEAEAASSSSSLSSSKIYISPSQHLVRFASDVIISRYDIRNIHFWKLFFQFKLFHGNFKNVYSLVAQIASYLKKSGYGKIRDSSKGRGTMKSNAFHIHTIVDRVLSFLDFKALCNVSVLNKMWYSMATSEPIWESLIVKDFAINPRLAYHFSSVGTGRSKDAYYYSLRLFRFAVYGRKENSVNSISGNMNTNI
jgi:hypothetical protein